MNKARMSPAEQANEAYYAAAAATLRKELASVISHMHEYRAKMDADEFKRYLRSIGMDEAAAQDFLASDGAIESMTSRMWVYFDSPLKPWAIDAA